MKNEEIEEINFSGWPIPDNYLIELGRVSALWTSLENLINICIGKLAGFNEINDPKPFILITHSSFPQRLDILSTLCEGLLPEFRHLYEYKKTIAVLKNAQKVRNRFLHNEIVFNPDTKSMELGVGSARGTLKVTVEKITIADIRRAVIAIDEAMHALFNLIFQKEEQPAWKRLASGRGPSDKNDFSQ